MFPVDAIPLPDDVSGRLYATSFSIVGPDPASTLEDVGASTLLCLITDHEIGLRYPDYGDWLATDGAIRILRLPTPDYGVTNDDKLVEMVRAVAALLHKGETVVAHCGAGLGRTGVLCTLVLVALGRPLEAAAAEVKRGRPGSGPDSPEQAEQLARLAPHLHPN